MPSQENTRIKPGKVTYLEAVGFEELIYHYLSYCACEPFNFNSLQAKLSSLEGLFKEENYINSVKEAIDTIYS